MKILIIQTAFIGDVVLATALVESIKKELPKSSVDFLLRKGNEDLLKNHPKINRLLIFNKKEGKYKNLFRLLLDIRKERYDYIINPHRFGTSGFLTALSRAKNKLGFDKNPFSFFYSKKYKHQLDGGMHETERNHLLISDLVQSKVEKPKLYPSERDYEVIPNEDYVCMAPASVWFTKQYPEKSWVDLANRIPKGIKIFLIGGPGDKDLCQRIADASSSQDISNKAGAYSFLQSAALISKAKMTYANDSAPMHFASAMNAPVTAIYCSTVPAFGFGPLSEQSYIAEYQEKLECRPCGIHGKKNCPLGHFNCSNFRIEAIFK